MYKYFFTNNVQQLVVLNIKYFKEQISIFIYLSVYLKKK